MGIIIGALVILLIIGFLFALQSAGFLGLLIVGGITALATFLLVKIAMAVRAMEKPGADMALKVISYILVIFCGIMVFVNLIIFIIGLSEGEVSYSGDICGICGGTGVFQGKSCFGCQSLGVSITEVTKYTSGTGAAFFKMFGYAVFGFATYLCGIADN